MRGVPASEAQNDPAGKLGKSIVFAVNQTHATALTKILNELQPDIAVTITSRIPEASALAKEFRDGKRAERIAVSVDMLSTGYNCRDLLNVGLMRPIFSPTEYIQIKGRGTRRYHLQDRQHRVREEALLPARFLRRGRILRGEVRLHRAAEAAEREGETTTRHAGSQVGEAGTERRPRKSQPDRRDATASTEIPVWEGT